MERFAEGIHGQSEAWQPTLVRIWGSNNATSNAWAHSTDLYNFTGLGFRSAVAGREKGCEAVILSFESVRQRTIQPIGLCPAALYLTGQLLASD